MASRRISRRSLLGMAAAGVLGAGIQSADGGGGPPAGAAVPSSIRRTIRSGAGGRGMRHPGSLPDPSAPAGTDQVPQIENFVVVMMENHSFDNLLGMLGRGDCFPKGLNGRPTITLADGHGNLVHAFHMPSECQTNGVGQNWNLAHHSLVDGNRGFVEGSTGEALGYFRGEDLPFTWDMARTFPIADRWFSSLLGQTDPNRRYLMAGTSLGQVEDRLNDDLPPNGTIFDLLNRYGITWKDYYSSVPSIGVWLPLLSEPAITANINTIDHFYTDAAAGALPQFSFLEPNYSVSSEENPQDIQFGDQFLAGVVNAVMSGPQWSRSMLIWTYDEWGGWYDHVPPPAAVPPDDIRPVLSPNQVPGRFNQYGFRVPAGVVSPFAIRDFVSHTVYDHTSVLMTLERKWNLPALTRRDANANDLFDMVDLHAPPAFSSPPGLRSPADPALSESCLATGPGTIPPRRAVTVGAVPTTPVIGPAGLPAGVVGTPYRTSLTAPSVGRGAQWTILSDDLPAGLVLDKHTGTISGVPTAAGSTGVTIGVSQGRGPVGARAYSVVVAAA
jgi:phospholipase C